MCNISNIISDCRKRFDIYEYETTNGSYIPPTPTKLGLYPAYEPVKYTDNTYVESQQVIQGHDGSKIIAFNDYRDDLLLELERRIYNKLSNYIKNDKFLSQSTAEILIDSNSIFSIKLRNYRFKILIGKLNNLDLKIKNFKAFYINASANQILNKYSVINLQFDNQVVCIKN